VHDDAFYVPKEMFEHWAARDPVERYRGWLREQAGMTDEEEDEITSSVKRLLNDALERAEASPLPDPSTLEDGVFASSDELDTPHHR
jgi:pyruvate dehydrogenase E1 component alpha subunit